MREQYDKYFDKMERPRWSSTNGSSVDFKFEVVVIPVLDVDRAKSFYGGLGWRLDADYASDDGYFRVIQFTPPGSGCSVIFGKNVTAATPGSAQGLYLIVSDVEAARSELIGRGIEISEVFHDANGDYAGTESVASCQMLTHAPQQKYLLDHLVRQ